MSGFCAKLVICCLDSRRALHQLLEWLSPFRFETLANRRTPARQFREPQLGMMQLIDQRRRPMADSSELMLCMLQRLVGGLDRELCIRQACFSILERRLSR